MCVLVLHPGGGLPTLPLACSVPVAVVNVDQGWVLGQLRPLLLRALVFSGTDSSQRMVWCVDGGLLSRALSSLWEAIQPAGGGPALFVLQPGVAAPLRAQLLQLAEESGYSDVVYAYSHACVRAGGEGGEVPLVDTGAAVGEGAHPAGPSDAHGHGAPHAGAARVTVADRTGASRAWRLGEVDPPRRDSAAPLRSLVNTWLGDADVSFVDVEAGPVWWGRDGDVHRPMRLFDSDRRWCVCCCVLCAVCCMLVAARLC